MRDLTSLKAAAAAHHSWALTPDRSARTAPARAAALSRFERKIREQFPDLDDTEVARRAEHLKKAYFLNLAVKSAEARARRKTMGA
jgi:hypothetical protein